MEDFQKNGPDNSTECSQEPMENEKKKKDTVKRVIAIIAIFLVLAAIFTGIIIAGQNLYDVFVK